MAARACGKVLTPDQWKLSMSEGDLEATVLNMCKLRGLHTMHIRKARRKPGVAEDGTEVQRWVSPMAGDGKGWPDWSIFGERVPGGPPAGLFRELKATKGVVSAEQLRWIGWLNSAGFNAGVWRPQQLIDGTIERELDALCAGKAARAAAARNGRPGALTAGGVLP